MGIFDRLRPWTLEGVERPWAEGNSIYAHLREHTDPKSGKLDEAGQRLPDETEPDPNAVSWAPGALDGVFGHHVGRGEPDELRMKQLEKALRDVLTKATADHLRHLYSMATRESLLSIIDDVTDTIRNSKGLRPERVHALGVVLAREAPHREAVKLGLALIGTIEGSDDDELLLRLGNHDEFTLFAAAALVNQNRGERALFRLAQRVDGWGRIQVVERLSETQDAEIQGWMLREGFRNSVMDEYLAYTCAMAGNLHTALAAESVDSALLHGAAGLLSALANGGPAEDLGDYPHAAAAVAAFLRQLDAHPLDLELVATLDALAGRNEVPAQLGLRIQELRARPDVRALIDEGLHSSDQQARWRANQAARARGIDTFEHHERRVRAGELGTSLFELMQSASEANVERALDAAMPHVPLADIASGPAETPGFGPEFAAHRNLDVIVQELSRFPGHGGALVAAALKSPLVRNRSMAVRALAAWRPARWSGELANALDLAIQIEPLEDVRERMQRVRAGGPYDDSE